MDNLYDFISSFDGIDRETGAFITFTIFLLIIYLIILLFVTIFNMISRWILFKKCGEEGWKAIIPVYNKVTLIKVSGLNWWWIFLVYVASIVSIIQSIFNFSTLAIESVSLSLISIIISFLSIFASITTIIAKVNVFNNLSKKFNKGAGHTALMYFFMPIMFLIMGLSKDYTYDEKLKVPRNGFFGK